MTVGVAGIGTEVPAEPTPVARVETTLLAADVALLARLGSKVELDAVAVLTRVPSAPASQVTWIGTDCPAKTVPRLHVAPVQKP